MASLKGKVIALTGASSGIGNATAKVLHARGASLALADVQKEKLEQTAGELSSSSSDGQQVTSKVVDVSKAGEVQAWIEDIIKDFGRLDGAANLAGVARVSGPTAQVSDEDFNFVMGVNLFGVFHCLRAELSVMAEGGAIVNAASVAGLTAYPGLCHYVASKHAVIGLTKSAAKEYGHKRIRVNAIAPGLIDTPMSQGSAGVQALKPMIPLQNRSGEPEEVAKLIAYLLSDDASYVSGSVVRIDGALHA